MVRALVPPIGLGKRLAVLVRKLSDGWGRSSSWVRRLAAVRIAASITRGDVEDYLGIILRYR